MPSTHTTPEPAKPARLPAGPTAKQLRYLRQLAEQTGRTFVTPKTAREASRQIELLKSGRDAMPEHEKDWQTLSHWRDREHIAHELQQAPRDATRFREDDVAGWGSSARWADPWDGHHTKED